MTYVGRMRCYFNRHGAAPLVWCIAPEDGTWEIALGVVLFNAPVRTVYAPKATPDAEDGRPSAWLEVDGVLVVAGNGAVIERRP